MRRPSALFALLLTGCPFVIVEIHDTYQSAGGPPDLIVLAPEGADLQLMGPVLPVIPDPSRAGWPVFAAPEGKLTISVPRTACPDDPREVRLVTREGAVRPLSAGHDPRYTWPPSWRIT